MKDKRISSFLLVVIMVFQLFLPYGKMVSAASMSGSGTQASPYLIQTVTDFYNISSAPKAYYKLMSDLDMENKSRVALALFEGSFDGNGHTISNINLSGGKNTALFSKIQGGKVMNLNLKNVKVVSTGDSAGALVGETANSEFSKISGENIQVNSTGVNVGGLVGLCSNITMTECSVKDSRATGNAYVGLLGGFVDLDKNVINKCYTVGGKAESATVDAGGLFGFVLNGNISQCYSTSDVENNGTSAGGLLGYLERGTVTECYATGNVTGPINTAGFIGVTRYAVKIKDCYATGSVSGVERAGGFISGLLTAGTILENCYSASPLTGSPSFGLTLTAAAANNINVYFDNTIMKISSPGTAARTTAQMIKKSNYNNWDFDTVWSIKEGEAYPILRFNMEVEEPPKPERVLKVVLEPMEQLQLSVDDDLAENTKLRWVHSDGAVATVDNNGLVTAISPGNCVITVSSADGTYTENIKVLVVENAKEYRLAIDLKVNQKCRLTIDDAEDEVGGWTVMNPSVATVTNKGMVTAVSKGLTIVTAVDELGNQVGQVYVRVR